MFDIRKIGAKIMHLRKEKDMTQMELADLMQVSYQAVSNWERGNSMPDISKLADLAKCLGVSIDILLDSSEDAQTVRKAMDEAQPLTIQEIASVAPMLKPSRLKQDVQKAGLEMLDNNSLLEIAPYLDSDQLLNILKNQMDLCHDSSALSSLAPFLDEDDLSKIATKWIEEDHDCGLLVPLAPFLSSEKKMEMIDLVKPESLAKIVALAPFMDSDDLACLIDRHAEYFAEHDGLGEAASSSEWDDGFEALLPFLDEDYLTSYAKKSLAKGDTKTLKAILPFIDANKLLD